VFTDATDRRIASRAKGAPTPMIASMFVFKKQYHGLTKPFLAELENIRK
jgi:hypothetical protein